VPGGAAQVQDIYPLTPMQEGILFHHLLGGEQAAAQGDAYIMPLLLTARARSDLDAFLLGLNMVVNRHDILRTSVHWQGLPRAVQLVQREVAVPVQTVDVPAGQSALACLSGRMAPGQLWMDLSQAPLVRVMVAHDEPMGQWHALVMLHHLIDDNYSLDIVRAEIRACMLGQVAALPAPVPYRAFVQRALAYHARGEAQAFFTQRLADVDEPTAPFGLLDVHGDGSRFEEATLPLEHRLIDRTRRMARQMGVSAAAVFHAAWAVVVARTSGRHDVVFGTVLTGRLQGDEGADRVIGAFINTLPVRMPLQGLSSAELVKQMQAELVELLAHDQAPLALAQRCRGVSSGVPLFSAVLNYRHRRDQSDADLQWPGIELVAGQERSNYPFAMSVDDDGDGFTLHAQTERHVGAARVVTFLATALDAMVQALEEGGQSQAMRVNVLSVKERAQVLTGFNQTAAARQPGVLIHQLFEAQAKLRPGAVAVEMGKQALSYQQVNQAANQLARHLRQLGVGQEQRVALCFERSVDMIVAMLAVLKAGGAYVPVDPAYPSERISYMLGDANPAVVLTQQALVAQLPKGQALVLALDVDQPAWLCEDDANLDSDGMGLHANALAYVIYTSGSTGQPKGVTVEHACVANIARTQQEVLGLCPESRILQFASMSFDASVWECTMAWGVGATLVLASKEQVLPGQALYDTLRSHGITHATLPPIAVSMMPGQEGLEHLSHLIVGGEACPASLPAQWARSDRGQHLINVYGPTETTACVTMHWCRPDDGVPPIGRPMANIQLYVLDEAGEPVAQGVSGEIYIGGAGVARGYLGRPELTAERFVPDGFSGVAGARLYRTGDVGRWRADGVLEYQGRNDHQVKIRGFRIELGEVESALLRCAGVREAVVLAREDEPGRKRLVAYVTAHDATRDAARDVVSDAAIEATAQAPDEWIAGLRSELRAKLPEHMIPSALVRLDQLPLTPNGKLDRAALPEPDATAQSGLHRQGFEAPQGPIEVALARIWCDLLGLPQVSRHDRFFDLGGHSLLIVQMIERLRQCELHADVRSVFSAGSLADLAQILGQGSVADVGPAVPPNLIPAGASAITPEMLPLIELSQAQIDQIVAQVPGGVANVQDIYPLAPLQEGILFHHLLDETRADAYILPVLLRVQDRTQLQQLLQALQQVIDRHDILRSAMLWQDLPRPVQVVCRQATLKVRHIELSAGAGQDDQASMQASMQAQMQALMAPEHLHMPLTQAPLVHVLVGQAPAHHPSPSYALIELHHIISDHISLEVMLGEVSAILQAQSQSQGQGPSSAKGLTSALILPEPVPYRGFVAQALHSAQSHDAQAYFSAKLGEVSEPTAPFDLLDVHGDGSGIDEAHQPISAELARSIRAQARQLGVSPAALFHVGWAQVVAHTSGRDDVVFGSVLSGRLQGTHGADRVLGMFINTLPLRLKLQGQSAQAAVAQAHAELIELLRYEQASLALAQRCGGS
jgi:amino acid adenylation domain-containing protein